MAKRIAIRLAALIVAGVMLTFAAAWTCALIVSPDPAHDGLDPTQLNRLRREFFEREGPDPGGGDPGTLFVAVAHMRPGVTFMDVAVEDDDLGADFLRGPLPHIGVTRAGWPLSALESQWHHDASRAAILTPPRREWGYEFANWSVSGNRLFIPRVLPLKPLWPAFAVDVAIWTPVAALAWYGPKLIVRFMRWRRGRCMACGYPIGESPVCTECGRTVRVRPVSAR